MSCGGGALSFNRRRYWRRRAIPVQIIGNSYFGANGVGGDYPRVVAQRLGTLTPLGRITPDGEIRPRVLRPSPAGRIRETFPEVRRRAPFRGDGFETDTEPRRRR